VLRIIEGLGKNSHLGIAWLGPQLCLRV